MSIIIIIIIVITIKSIPAALGRITATIAVTVIVMMTAVRVVDWVTDGSRGRLAVPAVVQTLLAVARPVTDAVLEDLVAVDALSDCRTIAIDRHVIAALERVVVTDVSVTFLLNTTQTSATYILTLLSAGESDSNI